MVYTHTLAKRIKKKAYYYYTSLAVFRDISSLFFPRVGKETSFPLPLFFYLGLLFSKNHKKRKKIFIFDV